MGAVLGEHRLDQRGAFGLLAGGGEHAGEVDLGVAAGIAALASGRVSALVSGAHAGDEGAHRGDAGIGPAFGEVEPGEGAHIGRAGAGVRIWASIWARVWASRRDPGGELGAGGLGAADLEQELGEGEGGTRPGSGGVGGGAEHRLGGVGGAVPEVPLDERGAGALVFREEAVHRREFGADGSIGGSIVAFLLEEGEAGEVQSLVVRGGGEAFLDRGEAAGNVLRLQAVGDEDEPGHDVARLLGEDALRHRHRRRAVGAAAEIDGRLQRPGAAVAGIELEGAGRVQGGGVEIPDLEGELGEGGVGLGEIGPDLDELLVLGEGVGGRALGAEQGGIVQPRLGMAGIQPEDVAELDRRPLLVARVEIGERALVMGLGALLLAVAAGEGDGEEEGAEESEAHGTGLRDLARPPGRARARGPARAHVPAGERPRTCGRREHSPKRR